MPIYEYECRKCKAHIEVFQKISDKPPVKCRKCGGRLERRISAPAIQFKGSGWYVTDYAGRRRSPEGGEEKTPGKSESSAAHSKSKSKEGSPKKGSDTTSSTKVPSGD